LSGVPGRIKVFHVIKSLGRGGAEMLLQESLRFADRRRFEYEFGYFLPWKDAMVPGLTAQGAEVTCFGARSNLGILLSARRVAAHLRQRRVDVLHCHLPLAGSVGRIAGRLAGVPVVYTEHNKLERYHPLTRRLNLALWDWQDWVIAVSGDVAASIRRHTRSLVRVDVVLNGVDTTRFVRSEADGMGTRRSLGIPPGAPVVGSVAVFRIQKRLQDWVESARRLHECHPEMHFVLVGDGPLRTEIVALADSLGLRGSMHFPGLREDVRPYLAAIDVYLMSSVFEGLPVALLEAMSMECAIVSTGVGGIPEVVRSGENGVLVEPKRADLLAAAVSDLLTAPETLRRYGAAARATVRARFSVERMVAEVEAKYGEIVERHRQHG
jgi:glycosyltransferase involved in cell wall biosynthesis